MGSDDAGLAYKNAIKADLESDNRVSVVHDVGVRDDAPGAMTYASVSIEAAERIARGEADRAILVCGTGIGVAIAANKVHGIRATVAHDSYSAERSILSNDCQVLTMGQRVIGLQLARRIVQEWLGYAFDVSSPSQSKVEVITRYESSKGPSESRPDS